MEKKLRYDGRNGSGWKRTVEIHQKSEEKINVHEMHLLIVDCHRGIKALCLLICNLQIFKYKQPLKFKSQLTMEFFAAVNHNYTMRIDPSVVNTMRTVLKISG